METQEELFEDEKDYIPDIDVADFITKYLNSKTRALIRENVKKVPLDFIIVGYRGLHNPDEENTLTASFQSGGRGSWGKALMLVRLK